MKIDLTGQRFGRLVALKRDVNYISPKGQKQKRWKCQCDCGNIKVVQESSLRYYGNTQSCGCYHKEQISKVGKANWRKY